MAYSDEQLVEVIAQQVRARLMAGGHGPGYTRSPAPQAPALSSALSANPAAPAHGCDSGPASCHGCGMCAANHPEAVEGILRDGAARIGAAPGTRPADEKLARYIDHTLLKPDATRKQLFQLAEEARKHVFATVCVNSGNVRLMNQFLHGSDVPVCAVVGFPLGAMAPRAKAFETREAIRCGAREIDMVLNIGALKSGDLEVVEEDIRGVVQAARPVAVKVILETSKLTEEEKVIACALSKVSGAAFVKTSTGFGGGGATTTDVTLMRRVVGRSMGVKASGGIRTREDVDQMIAAGANRIGASASVAIVSGGKGKGGY